MKRLKTRLAIAVGVLVLLTGCSAAGSGSGKDDGEGVNGPSCTATTSSNVVTSAAAAASNVMTVTVNGSLCGAGQYANEPCTSVTICTHGGACATIDNLLVDTGSYGLRVFSSVLSNAGITPTTIPTSGGNTLAECVNFGGGNSEFGQVGLVDVTLGNETKISNLPILVIDSLPSATPPFPCSPSTTKPDTDPSTVGFNGILGVGLVDQDCGEDCVTSSPQKPNFQYFSCSSSTCNCPSETDCPGDAEAPILQQVRNPVAALGQDNNGVILQLPGVPDTGAASVTGSLILGIATESNNQPAAGIQLYQADDDLTFTATFNPFSSTPLTSFIDSGSSLLFFPWPPPTEQDNTQLPGCGSEAPDFYCPTTTQSFATENQGAAGTASSCVAFNVANAIDQFNTGNAVFNNLAGSAGTAIDSDFDWGLPFFLGRQVYVGINGKSAPGLGTGPFWAY